MFQLIVVVIAVGLLAIIVAGGLSYFNSDTGTRVQTTQQLQGQFDGLASAIGTYRGANGGFLSSDINALSGLLPGNQIPTPTAIPSAFAWSLADTGGNAANGFQSIKLLCLSTTRFSTVGRGVITGIAGFVDNVSRTHSGLTVTIGGDCTSGTTVDGTMTSDALADMKQNDNLAIAFKGL